MGVIIIIIASCVCVVVVVDGDCAGFFVVCLFLFALTGGCSGGCVLIVFLEMLLDFILIFSLFRSAV